MFGEPARRRTPDVGSIDNICSVDDVGIDNRPAHDDDINHLDRNDNTVVEAAHNGPDQTSDDLTAGQDIHTDSASGDHETADHPTEDHGSVDDATADDTDLDLRVGSPAGQGHRRAPDNQPGRRTDL